MNICTRLSCSVIIHSNVLDKTFFLTSFFFVNFSGASGHEWIPFAELVYRWIILLSHFYCNIYLIYFSVHKCCVVKMRPRSYVNKVSEEWKRMLDCSVYSVLLIWHKVSIFLFFFFLNNVVSILYNLFLFIKKGIINTLKKKIHYENHEINIWKQIHLLIFFYRFYFT